MRKPYDPIADEEPHIVAEYHFPNCTAYIADNYLRRADAGAERGQPAGCPPRGVADPRAAAAEGRLPAASN